MHYGAMTHSRFDGLCIIDADTHLTEPHDLWTARAPKGYEDRVPQVHDVDGIPTWTMDGKALSRAGASGVVGADGVKVPGTTFFQWNIEDVHPAAYDVDARVALMDEQGIWAQIVYPNTVGFGGQKFQDIGDETLRRLSVELYNDAMAEIQDRSAQRLFPMGIVPWWDVDLAVREIERMATLGLRGVNTTTAPHDHGLPDLGDEHWNPMWEAVSGLGLPLNFHIGASESSLSWFGSVPWPSLNGDQKLGLGSAMMYLNNAGVIGNIIYSGVLERFPELQVVSVESGVGWIPFLLKALDYQVGRDDAGVDGQPLDGAVGLLPPPDPLVLLVRARRDRGGDRERRRRPPPVRDRLPPPDVRVPRRPRARRRRARRRG